MLSKSKSILFSAFKKVYRLLWGRGLGKVPGAYRIQGLIFELLWPNKENIIEIQGSKMCVNPGYKLPKSYKRTFQAYTLSGIWEELTTEMFKKAIKEGDVVVDLGANLGYYTLLAARLVGKRGRVYAFEPEPINYSLLLKNIEINGYDNIVAMQKAVSDTTGTVRLFLDNTDTGAHTIYEPDDKREFIEIESVILDELFKDKKHPINVIKMDIEGAEMAALTGMDRIIRENENLKMLVEFYPAAIRGAGHSPEEFINRLLQDYHFAILAIDDYTRNKQCVRINKADELINLCEGERVVNLLLDRRRES